MTKNDLLESYTYHYWANNKLLNVVSQLTPEEFSKEVAGSYGSIRNTLVHVMSAEWGWLSRCGGRERGNRLQPEDYPTPQSLIEKWRDVERYMRAFLKELTDEDINGIVAYQGAESQLRTMPLGELLNHCVVHAVHHRGQVAMMLRMLGYTPGNFDILYFYADRRDVEAW